MKAIFFWSLIVGFTLYLNAQSPVHDGNWKIITALSDDFNGQSLDGNKWIIFQKYNYPWGEGYCFNPNTTNVKVDSGFLKLITTEKLQNDYDCSIPDAPFYSGGIQSKDRSFQYGYLEISAKLPGFYNDGVPCGEGFWPAFWTYYKSPSGGYPHPPGYIDDCVDIHDEIDILEPNGVQYATADQNVCGFHDESLVCPWDPTKRKTDKVDQGFFSSTEPLFLKEHKYAVEWLSDRIIYYFDDLPFHYIFDDPAIIMQPQNVVIDSQLGGMEVNEATPFPQTMKVLYFYYYYLDITDCNVNCNIFTNNQLSSFYNNPSVKRNITFGNQLEPITLLLNEKNTFRFNNEILINGEFNVPINCVWSLIPTPCN